MARKHPYSLPLMALNVSFILFCAIATYHTVHKAGLTLRTPAQFPIIVNGISIPSEDHLEFYTSHFRIDMPVEVSYPADNSTARIEQLAPYYSTGSIITSLVIALMVYGFGLAVYLERPEDPAASVFHAGSLLVGATLLGVKTVLMVKPYWLGFIAGGYYFIAYTLLPVIFLHFTILFPAAHFTRQRKTLSLMYLAALVIAGFYYFVYAKAVMMQSTALFERTMLIGSLQNLFFFVLFTAGIVNLLASYRGTSSTTEKRKLRWVLFSLCVGPAPFILLWVLPQALRFTPVIPELVFKSFLLLVPAGFAIAILKYHALDIDLLINRSVVYGAVITAFLLLYAGIVAAAARIVTVWSAQSSLTVSIIVAVVTALLFDPMRRRTQAFVDRSFFRIQYNFREAQRQLSQAILDCVDVEEIAALMVQDLQSLVPVERIGFFLLALPQQRLQLLAHEQYDILERHSVRLEMEKLAISLKYPVALPFAVEPGVTFDRGDEDVLRRWGIAVIMPMVNRQGESIGFLVLGSKKSGLRFTVEDIDLIHSLSAQAAMAIERLALHQKLILEHAEAERLAELSAAKSYFISSVTHDLKTPLTSIKLFAELLQQKADLPEDERAGYLRIIEGESDRLNRLINNVLDFSRVERGVKDYTLREVDLNELVERVLTSMQYQFTVEHCTVERHLSFEPIFLQADPDALMELLDNLLSNALRYTPADKKIAVHTCTEENWAIISVQDNGIGMTKEEIENLCTPFYRTEAAKAHGKGGTGLGLSVVKHIIDGHGGKLEITSTPGTGSTFSVRLPIE